MENKQYSNSNTNGNCNTNSCKESRSRLSTQENEQNLSYVILSYLDEVEDRVQALMRNAQNLSHERDSLLTVLSHLQEENHQIINSNSGRDESSTEGECQEICSNIERLKKRCKSIEIKIHTIRSAEQECAYKTVNSLVKDLEHICLTNGSGDQTYSQLAQSYLNACVSDMSSTGPIDYTFQGMILGCRLEDQKQVRQRLECLVNGKCHFSHIEEEFTASAQNVEPSQCLSKGACSSEKI